MAFPGQYFFAGNVSFPQDRYLCPRKCLIWNVRSICPAVSFENSSPVPVSEESRLREENARLRKALEYFELRNEALREVLRIGKEKYGLDLLKKSWRQAVDSLRQRHPGKSLGCLCGLFGKSREGYCSVSRERCARLEVGERDVIRGVLDLSRQAPGLGAYKLFLILRGVYPREMRGCDWFYRLMHDHGLMLKPPWEASHDELHAQPAQVRQCGQGFRPHGSQPSVGG